LEQASRLDMRESGAQCSHNRELVATVHRKESLPNLLDRAFLVGRCVSDCLDTKRLSHLWQDIRAVSQLAAGPLREQSVIQPPPVLWIVETARVGFVSAILRLCSDGILEATCISKARMLCLCVA
jgi:hypothetical protein